MREIISKFKVGKKEDKKVRREMSFLTPDFLSDSVFKFFDNLLEFNGFEVISVFAFLFLFLLLRFSFSHSMSPTDQID